jgi:hypothetical protein
MKRGNFVVTGELLTKILGLPDDFKISGVDYVPDIHVVKIYGYSEAFANMLECAVSLTYPIDQFRHLEAEVDK